MKPPMHGAATTPTKRPMAKAPNGPLRAPALFIRRLGIRISHIPNIERAIATRTAAMPARTNGFCSRVPKSLPERAAATPRAE
jgi:hypothetical protein